jgi:hypothetical protein
VSKRKQQENWVARVTIHDGYARVETKGKGGMVSKPVTVDSLALALAGIPISSGVLPKNTLFYTTVGADARLGIYIPPDVYGVHTPARHYLLPLPGLILTGYKTTWELYAVATGDWPEWPDAQTRLCYPPMPNVFNNGTICQGEMRFPECTTENIWQVFRKLVMGSYFTGHIVKGRCQSASQNIFDLWERLAWGKPFQENVPSFPNHELVPMKEMTLGDLVGRR